MIYRKGEVVQVVHVLDDCMQKYVGKIGRVDLVGNLEKDFVPFLVSFYSNGVRDRNLFSHKELKLLDNIGDNQKKRCHYNEACLYRIQEKI